MTIEIGDNGLRSRYWWSSYEIPSINDPAQAAYSAIRLLCPWLEDGSHIYEARDYGPEDENSSIHLKNLKRLIQDSRYHIIIRRTNGSYWFQMAYRVPGEPF